MAIDGTKMFDEDPVEIVSRFLLQAPPGEFNEVFNDVRMLLNNDKLLKDRCATAVTRYNKDQFMPVRLEGFEGQTLITQFNELPNGRFFDTRSKNTFKYDHLSKEAVDMQPNYNFLGAAGDSNVEQWAKFLQEEADKYIDSHYEETGVAAIFPYEGCLMLCIESHRFQPKNFWNGRWRSQWTLPMYSGTPAQAELKGVFKVQVHYYEDGNVQLVSSKDVFTNVNVTVDFAQSAKDIFKAIWDEETKYQDAIQDNYQQMSSTTFKTLRRQLPITGAKFDWNNTHAYRIGKDLKPQ